MASLRVLSVLGTEVAMVIPMLECLEGDSALSNSWKGRDGHTEGWGGMGLTWGSGSRGRR